MRRFLVVAAAVCAASASAVSAQSIGGTYDVEYATRMQAQAASVAGKYKVEFDSQIRMGPEGVQVAGRSPALLVLEVKGDSVFGTFQRLDGSQAVRKLAGTMRGDTIVVLSEPSLRVMNRNGEEIRQTMSDEFKLTISGDAIAGTMTPTQGMEGAAPMSRKVDGKREK